MSINPLGTPKTNSKENAYFELKESPPHKQHPQETHVIITKSESASTKFDRAKGMIFMTISVMSGTFYTILGKYAYTVMGLPPMYDLFWRCAGVALIFIVQAKYAKVELLNYPSDLRLWLISRGLFGCLGMITFVTALQLAPLTKVLIITYIGPLLTAIAAYFILEERLSKFEVVGTLFSFSGLLLILYPSLQEQKEKEYNLESVGLLIALVNAFMQAGIFISVKKISSRVNYVVSGFYWSIFNLLAAPTVIIVCSITPERPLMNDIWFHVLYIAAVIPITYLFQMFIAKAFQYEKASRLMPINYTNIALTIFFDYLLFDPKLRWTDIVGSVLIVGYSFTIAILRSLDIIR